METEDLNNKKEKKSFKTHYKGFGLKWKNFITITREGVHATFKKIQNGPQFSKWWSIQNGGKIRKILKVVGFQPNFISRVMW